MTRKIQVLTAILAAVSFCGVILAQEPVLNIDKKRHPALAQAQEFLIRANQSIEAAQKANKYDMQNHAEKARQLLLEADKELKAAAEAANAADAKAHEKGKR
jgi:hypothetical protein